MVSLKATIRDKKKKINALREAGFLPGVLYGEGLKATGLEVNEKEFEKIFKEAGESSLISLELGGKKYDVLIHEIAKDPITGKFSHIDFFSPSAKKKIEAEIPIVFEGEPSAVKDFGGILVKELQEIKVKGLAQKLPREIIVDLSSLKTLEDRILVGNLKMPEGIEALRHADEIVALVTEQKKEKVEASKQAEPDKATKETEKTVE